MDPESWNNRQRLPLFRDLSLRFFSAAGLRAQTFRGPSTFRTGNVVCGRDSARVAHWA